LDEQIDIMKGEIEAIKESGGEAAEAASPVKDYAYWENYINPANNIIYEGDPILQDPGYREFQRERQARRFEASNFLSWAGNTQVPQFQSGGIMTGLGIVGEKGPEVLYSMSPTMVMPTYEPERSSLLKKMMPGGFDSEEIGEAMARHLMKAIVEKKVEINVSPIVEMDGNQIAHGLSKRLVIGYDGKVEVI
jgi:hypothetical protein